MGQITIQGRLVTVSDNFFKLSPEEQDETVDEIAASMGSAPQTPPGPWDEAVARRHQPEAPLTWEGAGKSIGGGLMQAAASIPGAIGDLPQMVDRGIEYAIGAATGTPADQVRAEAMANRQMLSEETGLPMVPQPWEVINSQKVLGAMEPYLGKPYQPQNTTEKYLQTVTSFLPAAVAPGGPVQKATQVAVPGMTSEFAGQALEGTGWEAPARVAGAVAGGGVTALASRRGVPERMVSSAMATVDDATLTAAGRLMIDARQMGVPLSWPEAVQHVSNGATRLPDIQRVVENSTGGGATMRQFYANRPEQIDAAGRAQFDQIAPQPMIPERLGPRVQAAAEGDIRNVNAGINRQARPLYNAAEQQQLPPNSPVLQDPAYIEAVRSIRNNPVIAPRVAHLPDNSVGMVDLAQRMMRDRAQSLRTNPQNLNTYEASLTGEARRSVSNEARNTSPEYDAAVQHQRQLRDQYLNPLEEGPTGKLAGTTDTRAQTKALFPSQPAAQSEVATARAMRGIRQTDPQAAEGIVRQHLETTFNEATKRLQSGPNRFGGAKFSAVVAGNPQQRSNLIAAIRALPNGAVLWRGFNRFLDVMEATGRAPAPNSATKFNEQITKELEQGPLTGEAAAVAASPAKAISYVKDKYAEIRLGKGTAELARIFTTGNLDDFRRLLTHGPGSPQAVAVMVRFLSQISAAANHPGATAD